MINLEDLRSSAIRNRLQEHEGELAAAVRGFLELSPSDWLGTENVLLRLVLEVATLDPKGLPFPNGKDELVLSLLARTFENASRDAPYETDYLSSLSAVTFAAAGNFAAAGVVAKGTMLRLGSGPFESWMIATLGDPSMSFFRGETPEEMQEYCTLERKALMSGSTEAFLEADRVFESSVPGWLEKFPQSDALLILLWSNARKRFLILSASRVLRATGRFPEEYVQSVVETVSPLLYPAQVIAIERTGLLNPDENSLITFPTSTGKTLLGELAIVAALSDDRPIGVYLSPYRALADQVSARIRNRLTRIRVRTEIRRGGYLSTEPISGDVRTVIVATPEAFDAFLRSRPELRLRIACCVFDEFHMIEQPVRGLRYEALVGRLRDLSLAREGSRIVALSPLMSASEMIAAWLGVGVDSAIQSNWVPTARRFAIVGPNRQLHYFTPVDSLLVGEQTRELTWKGSMQLPHQLKLAPENFRAKEFAEYSRKIAENVVAVAVDQCERLKAPVLILANSRRQSRILAGLVCEGLPKLESDHPAHRLSVEVSRRCPYLLTLRNSLACGVGYHNAALPNWVKEQLEELMRNAQLSIVCATTTLAEGVDLPFRVVVLADWQSWTFGQRRTMPTILFRNIAGRSGRAGFYTAGDTIIVDNPGGIGSEMDYAERYREYLDCFIDPGPVSLDSGIHGVITAGRGAVLGELDAAIESQFLAYVDARTPAEGFEEQEFASSLFASQFVNARTHVLRVTKEFSENMLVEDSYPMLTRNSPLALTALGRTVLLTGLSPRSGVALSRFLANFVPPKAPRKGAKLRSAHSLEWIPLVAAFHDAVMTGARFVAELVAGRFGDIGRRGFPVNRENFLLVMLGWLCAVPVEEIAFLTLRQKELQNQAEAWLGSRDSDLLPEFEDQIEQVAAFLSGYIAPDWSWVFRGTAAIAGHLSNEKRAELEFIAQRFEYGVRYQLSVRLIQKGCGVDRAKLDFIVGRFLEQRGQNDSQPDDFLVWIRTERAALIGKPIGRFSRIRVDGSDVLQITAFLER